MSFDSLFKTGIGSPNQLAGSWLSESISRSSAVLNDYGEQYISSANFSLLGTPKRWLSTNSGGITHGLPHS